MKNIAIIPARGGSKRLPRKNILDLNGMPMIAYPILAAIKSKVFDDVIVSTEDIEIAEISKKYGATVINRSIDLTQDKSTVAQVCLSVINQIHVEIFCCIYATAALLQSETIRGSYQMFLNDKDINYLMGVSEYNYSPVQALIENKYGELSYLMPDYVGIQSQNYPKLVVSNGSFVWGRARQFQQDKLFYSEKLKGYLVSENEVCDIDSALDYEKLKARFS
ncbi:acylneuraminate cytidylyltransferase family protein [Candidatus Methylopumilus universalis]|uniref:acylneuraminate cytidylyltransferase family protein n=1 Tax=Candidatus Methylopumilus universalis TaxID=2588536 RepID=UPI00111D37C0|nr:acylneuraminate cytidylyltransferase family protein [Candidatus Methylopumilus universalis]QDC47519.1 acylneuraminate cytidylyltransferase family protein [Candidatus Methylopumilus universalis]QDC72052.1 acylneuraminate cytidylyltransferase family protein [Candidatus Methylopumilus universalis]